VLIDALIAVAFTVKGVTDELFCEYPFPEKKNKNANTRINIKVFIFLYKDILEIIKHMTSLN